MFRRLFSLSFFILGLVFLFLFSYSLFQRINPWGLEKGFEQYAHASETPQSSVPQRIVIDSLEVDLPVISANIENNKFETTKDGVSYLASSGVPGKSGNVILYGHNWANILGNLPKIKVGDTVKIYASSGEFHEYKIDYTAKVTPDEVHILNQTEDARVTIYTCTGLFDTKRFVAVGTLVK